MSTGLIISYLLVLGLLYILGRSFWRPISAVFRVFLQGAFGALGIYLFNLIAAYWNLAIPLNPFNCLFTGFLGIPGLLSLLVIRYWIKL
jgi:inhibitor of the pro-sigma K processing machinery